MNDKLISCQAAINIAMQYCPDDDGTCSKGDMDIRELLDDLENLPSAQPERKRGMWIKLDMHAHIADHKCTACGEECYVPTCMGEPMYIYCPNCGAKMDTEEESDD